MRFSRHAVINFFVNHSGIFGRRMVEGNGSGGRRTERNLGEMPSTFRGDLSAYNLWIAYRTSRDVPVATTKEELSGDNDATYEASLSVQH